MSTLYSTLPLRAPLHRPAARLVALANALMAALELDGSELTTALRHEVSPGKPEEMLAAWIATHGADPASQEGLATLPLLVAALLDRLDTASSKLTKEVHHAAH